MPGVKHGQLSECNYVYTVGTVSDNHRCRNTRHSTQICTFAASTHTVACMQNMTLIRGSTRREPAAESSTAQSFAVCFIRRDLLVPLNCRQAPC